MKPDINVIALTAYDGNGYPETQVVPIGAHVARPTGTKAGSSVMAEAYHPYGFIGRPKDADFDTNGNVTNGSRVLFFYEGSTVHSVALDDPRVTGTLPQIPKGGSLHYGSGGSYVKHDDVGNCTVHVPSGKSITIEMEGGATIEISSSGVRIKGLTSTAPCIVGDGTPLPANAVLTGTPQAGQTPSTILFATS